MQKKRNLSKSSKIKQPLKKVVKSAPVKKKHKKRTPFFSTVQSQLKSILKVFTKLSLRTKALFVFGLLFLLISLFWHLNQTIQLAFFTPHVVPVKNLYAIPTELIIEKISIDMPIEETIIHNGIWQVGEKGASHLTISARPGENGPIILYGHNTLERLGPIRWLSKGDTIALKTADGKIHTYTIDQTMTVAPNKMDVFTQRTGETLIIYTCDGFADLQRFVIIAQPLPLVPSNL